MKYTRNPWPLVITLAFILFGLGTAALVVMACSQRADLVSSNYYEQELKFQYQIDRLSRTSGLGSRATVSYDSVKGSITISLPPGPSHEFVSGRIQLYRPSSARLDREMPLALDDKGYQCLDASPLPPGLWKVRVSWTAAGQDFFIDQKIILPRKATS